MDDSGSNAYEEIRNLHGRYALAVDRRDFDTVAACFTDDAVASYSGLEIEPGVENIVDHIRGVSRTDVSQHYITPVTIEVDGDHATSVCYGFAILIQEKDGKPGSLARGMTYEDKLRKVDGRWRIARRLHTAHWSWDLPVLVDPGGMWEPRPDPAGESSIYRTVR